MRFARLLIANRGEIAIRIARTAADLGIETVGVFAEDDATSLHRRHVDTARALRGSGPRAYLDIEQLLAVARDAACDAVHPGYGFLSEQATFARRCAEAGFVFVGPRPETLELLGDKVAACALAERWGVEVPRGTKAAVNLDEARAFLAALAPGTAVMVKAVAGGGGRGLRVVRRRDELDDAWARCRSEAQAAFGDDALYVEELLPRVRHVEVQVIGDGTGAVIHLGERDCSLQRRHQKLVEVTPAPGLADDVRARLAAAAVRMAAEVRYANVGTFEFLVDAGRLAFIEANPRLQVEHTVTEERAGAGLVAAPLRLRGGCSLADRGLRQEDLARPRGFAMQVRVNLETLAADGSVRPSTGVLAAFEVPTGRGVRVDTAGYAGYRPSTSFDSLLAKVVVRNTATDFAGVVAKTCRALSEFRTDGVSTNLPFLRNLLRHPALATFAVTTRFVEEHLHELLVDHAVAAPVGGIVRAVHVAAGDTVYEGSPLVVLDESAVEGTAADAGAHVDLAHVRPDLAEVEQRHAQTRDAARPDAVARRRQTAQRTARENVDDLCDPGTFVEYGPLVIAAQRRRRPVEELIERTPADGLVAGIGRVNGHLFDEPRSRCVVMAYDYTVLAGTQGIQNHRKQDRLFDLAADWRLPVVFFTEGGGGRPGDTDGASVARLDCWAFNYWGRLSGLVPLVGINSGRRFAGHAALLGCCDGIIATGNSSIGMGGPAMIEGGGLGVFHPDQVGPMHVQRSEERRVGKECRSRWSPYH